MKTINKQPKIRFKGYTDEWQQRKLGDVASFYKGKGYAKKDLVDVGHPILLYGSLYTNYKTVIEKVDTFAKLKEKSVLSNGNEVVVPSSGESAEDIARASAINKNGIILGGDLNIIRPIKELQIVFLALNLSNGLSKKELIKSAQGNSVVHLYNSDLKSVHINYPSIKEQTKIGNFFKQLDDTIALHQRKLEALEKTKKSFLQKMFPKKDKTKPEIRFAGFTDDWEQRKLGKIGKTQSGVGFPNTEQGGTEGIPFFKVSDMNNEGNENEMITANNYVSKEQIERKKWKPIEDVPAVIFAKVGAAIMLNRKRIVRSLFLLDNNTMAYIFDNSWDADFGKTMFETINLPKYAQVGALPSYNSSDIENISIVIPNVEEQQKIGSFFKQLDDTIALHQRQLEVLKNMKTSFLQKMYI